VNARNFDKHTEQLISYN